MIYRGLVTPLGIYRDLKKHVRAAALLIVWLLAWALVYWVWL